MNEEAKIQQKKNSFCCPLHLTAIINPEHLNQSLYHIS